MSSPSAETRRPLLTVEQFASALSLQPKTVRNWIYQRSIPYVRLRGRTLRLRPETLDAMIDQGDVQPRAHRRARIVVPELTKGFRTGAPRPRSGGAR